MRIYIFLLSVVVMIKPLDAMVIKNNDESPVDNGIAVGMSGEEFTKNYPKEKIRTYRVEGTEEWITYNIETETEKPFDMLTAHLIDDVIIDWKINDRKEIVREYLNEYCSRAFLKHHPKIFAAITDALERIPHEVFISVTDRARPILFTEYHNVGIARFANSSEIFSFEGEPPSFMDGMTLVKLSTELEDYASSYKEIEGIILHEIAHRYLEHIKRRNEYEDICAIEREANRTVKKWGFEEEYEKASEMFGQEKHGGSICKDEEPES